jgi:hypothetical protein
LNTGGGGGTFVWRPATNSLLIAAGGGSGLGTCGSQPGQAGQATLGGSGNGGAAGTYNCGINEGGGSGAGWLSNGAGTVSNTNTGGVRALMGGTGGAGGVNGGGFFGTAGGFGGAGGGGGNCGGPGGGGGYTGGNGGDNTLCGGGAHPAQGGTSYNTGINQVNLGGINAADGQVVFSYTGSSATVAQTAGLPSGSLFPVGTTTNTFEATDASGNKSSCSFSVTVSDTQAPALVGVPANATVECDAVPASANVTATDNCSFSGVVSSTETRTNGNCPSNYTLTRTWSTTDAAGNTTTATQVVTVQDTKAPVITTAAGALNATLECSDATAIAAAEALVPMATDNCAVPTRKLVSDVKTDACGSTYTRVKTWNFADACGNVSASFTQTIVVRDTKAPVLIVPAPISLTNDAGICGAVVNFAATASDNCSAPVLTYSQKPGTVFPVGQTTVTVTATDACGNATTGSFSITVADTEKPAITAPAAISQTADASHCYATVALGTPVTADNCAVDHVSNNAPAVFPVGNTIVTWTVIDIYGNSNTATQVVTVTDNEAPVLSCPAAITVTNDPGKCGASLTNVLAPAANSKLAKAATQRNAGDPLVETPAATDNCGVQTIAGVRNDGLAIDADYPVGTTIITWTATDIHGNKTTCTQAITVTDTEAPSIVCAPAQTQTADAGDCGAIVTVIAPATADNCGVASLTNNYTNTANASAHYPVGTTTITWTVTDIHGNTSSCTQTITVTDNEKPVITCAPAQTQTADAADCGAKVTVVSPVVSDNCAVATVTNNYTNTANASARYPVGTTTVTWTVTDIHGNASTCTQTITVTDNEKPSIVCAAPVAVTNDKGACGATVTLATPATADNCGVASVVSNHPATFYPVGTTTVTWTVTDIHGNKSTCTQTVTVADTEAPSITCAPAKTQTADGGKCGANVTVVSPAVADNCAVASVTNSYNNTANASGFYPVGTTTILWVVTDIHGNTSSCSTTVTVTDNEKPAIVCASPIVACDNEKGNTYTLSIGATDNCAVRTITYVLTGATPGTGDGKVVTRNFNLGVTTITWTVTDIHGNVSTCSTTVTINKLPVANITFTGGAFCEGITLTGGSTLAGPFGYQWTLNGTTVFNTQTINLGNTNANGTYNLYVTDGNGCRSSLAATYTYNKENVIGNYTILGFKYVMLNEGTMVTKGSVGVWNAGQKADIKRNTSIAAPGAFLKAPVHLIQETVNVPNRILGQAMPTLPAMQYYSGDYAGLSSYTVPRSATVTLTGNYSKLTIGAGANVTLTGNTFRNIDIAEGAKVTFTSTTLNIETIDMGKGQQGFTIMNFAPNTNIRVTKYVHIFEDCIVNQNGCIVNFYVYDPSADRDNFTVKGSHTTVNANVYAPKGIITVTGGSPAGTFMNGMYIAESVESVDKSVVWGGAGCNSCSPGLTRTDVGTKAVNVTEAKAQPKTDASVLAYPNPNSGRFSMQFNGFAAGAVQVQFLDGNGKVVLNRQVTLTADGQTASFDLGKMAAGIYNIRVAGGTEVKFTKVVIAR